jgi:hypothetical protein
LGRAVLLLALPLSLTCGDPIALQVDAGGTISDARTEITDSTVDACVAQPFVSENRDIDILFVVATSSSMSTIDASQGSRWDAASSAIRTFVTGQSGQHFGAGILFFPLMIPGGDAGDLVEACSGSDYLAPAVPIAPLEADGAHAAAFEAVLGSRSLAGGNAMAAALTGALKQAARAKAATGHIIQTVLVTDGASDPCGGAVIGSAAAAGDAFQTDHLETYVLGVGPDASNLDPIAAAGGTFHAYAAPGNETVGPVLATLGAAMRRCHFYFPMVLAPDDTSRLDIAIDDRTTGTEFVSRFDNGSLCKQGPGWFFDSPVAPAYATFCPATCDGLLQRPDRVVSAMLGCFVAGYRPEVR